MGELSTTIFFTNYPKSCPLPSDKELKNGGGGCNSYCSDVNSGLHAIKWYESNCVHLDSTFAGAAESNGMQKKKLTLIFPVWFHVRLQRIHRSHRFNRCSQEYYTERIVTNSSNSSNSLNSSNRTNRTNSSQ